MSDRLYRWAWEAQLPDRHGQLCRLLSGGALQSTLVEFIADGHLHKIAPWESAQCFLVDASTTGLEQRARDIFAAVRGHLRGAALLERGAPGERLWVLTVEVNQGASRWRNGVILAREADGYQIPDAAVLALADALDGSYQRARAKADDPAEWTATVRVGSSYLDRRRREMTRLRYTKGPTQFGAAARAKAKTRLSDGLLWHLRHARSMTLKQIGALVGLSYHRVSQRLHRVELQMIAERSDQRRRRDQPEVQEFLSTVRRRRNVEHALAVLDALAMREPPRSA